MTSSQPEMISIIDQWVTQLTAGTDQQLLQAEHLLRSALDKLECERLGRELQVRRAQIQRQQQLENESRQIWLETMRTRFPLLGWPQSFNDLTEKTPQNLELLLRLAAHLMVQDGYLPCVRNFHQKIAHQSVNCDWCLLTGWYREHCTRASAMPNTKGCGHVSWSAEQIESEVAKVLTVLKEIRHFGGPKDQTMAVDKLPQLITWLIEPDTQ